MSKCLFCFEEMPEGRHICSVCEKKMRNYTEDDNVNVRKINNSYREHAYKSAKLRKVSKMIIIATVAFMIFAVLAKFLFMCS